MSPCRIRFYILVAVALLLTAATVVRAPAQPNGAPATWKEYVNARFGFLRYPAALVASRAPTNGAGQEFHSADGQFSLAAQGQFLGTVDPDDSLEKRFQDELTARAGTVTYQRKTATWYVLSGVNANGFEFYHKFFVRGRNWREFTITYPHAQARRYDPWVEKIAKSFVPFPAGGDYDRVIKEGSAGSLRGARAPATPFRAGAPADRRLRGLPASDKSARLAE